jgi:hypothetical protein
LEVGDVVPIAVPTDSTGSRSFLHRVEERLLALVIRAVRLHEVHYRKLVAHVTPYIRDLKVEPLRVNLRLVIVLQKQVVGVGLC